MHFSNKKVFYENLVGFTGLSVVFFNVLILLNLMFQDSSLHGLTLPLFLLSLGIPILSFLILICISSLVYIIIKFVNKSQIFTKYKENMIARFSKRSKLRNDIYRKLAHVLIFIGLFVFILCRPGQRPPVYAWGGVLNHHYRPGFGSIIWLSNTLKPLINFSFPPPAYAPAAS